MEMALGITVVGLLCIALLVWRGRDSPAKRAEREATIRWYRQHRPQIKAAIREREERINEIAEGVRRGKGSW